MKKTMTTMMCLLAMLVAGTGLRAQEVTIRLMPGWNWIAYPYPESVSIETALGDFEPMEGDVIESLFGYSEYFEGYGWFGGIESLKPGWGYMYFSNRTEAVNVVLHEPASQSLVATATPTDIIAVSAVVGGTVTVPEGGHVFLRGVCWGTGPSPDIDGDHTTDGTGTGGFSSTLEGLNPNTTYYVRAYAVSDKGLAYGNEQSFTTLSSGILNGLFSVGENNQVYFSQGNLQYQASTNTWQFADNQWDYVGEGNANASATYEGWIDLFSWGTSGYDLGVVWYQPWSSGGDDAAYGNYDYDLCDGNGQADWGYNAISNGGNQEMQWRTCRTSEWQYLLESRQTTSGIRFAKASVNGINGLVILPDNWNSDIYDLNNANDGSASYDTNVISLDDWSAVLETNGAVFLPASGRIQDWANNDFGEIGMYWSASHGPTPWLKCLTGFSNNEFGTTGSYYPDESYSVRLVRPASGTSYSIEAVANPTEGGTISGTGTYDYYSTATLTAIPNEGYSLYQWKEHGNVVSTENTYSVVALFDRNLEACFLENSTYPLLYSFIEDDHTATVIGHWDGQNASGDLVIPETVMHNGEAYTVTAIGSNAFNGCSGLTSVVIPNTVISIGESAFEGCSNLTSIIIPNSVTYIGNWTFSHCNSLTEITIPNSVSHIGINPFHDCTNLAQITVELGNLYYDSRDSCNAIIETSSNSLISGCLNTVIPNSVTVICRDAFLQIPITTISIPASVVRIDMSAFALTSLSVINIYADVPPLLNDGPFYGVDKSIPVYVPCGSIEAYQNASGWSEFTNFIAVGQCSGVVTVTASPADYGTVTGGGSFEGGETCTVTATPNEGYYFLCWKENDQWVSSQAIYTFPVYRDRDLTAVFTISAENVINGDFEQGNVGFSSEYEYNYDFGWGGYYVDYDAHGRYSGLGHGGTGNFMLIDGATEPNVIVWTEQLSVAPNTYYSLSAWVCTLCGPSASLQFSINGTQIGDVFTAPSQTNTWQQFSATWYNGNSTTATITIIDQNTQAGGNDFGLDDISFRELDPSAGGDHAYVDLGLPSGLLWATCNVGADSPEEYGDYFAWGETQPKNYYFWSTYQYCNGTENTLTKYCNNSSYGFNGFNDNLTTLLPEDDAATANWGSNWRMPTKEEWQELLDNTTITWTTQNGVNGRLFTAANGNSLFLPAAGYRGFSGLYYVGSYGYYWSSSLGTDDPHNAWILNFISDHYGMYGSGHSRDCGRPIRPVRSAQN